MSAARPAPRRTPPRRPTARRAPSPCPSSSRPPSRLSETERARVRRIVRATLKVVVGVQALALLILSVPEAQSLAVAVTNFLQIQGMGMNGNTLGAIASRVRGVETELETGALKRNSDRLVELAEQHSAKLGGSWNAGFDAITTTPTDELEAQLSFANTDAVTNLETLVPGAVPWENYHREYAASADATLLTLRTSLAALNRHYEDIQDASRLEDLASEAGSADSYLAMDELQVRSSLEVARQLHALRAQQALSTNLYAVAESHRIGSEARTKAKDAQLDCSILAVAIGGGLGVGAEAALC